jgi:hypothetical protein
VMVKMTITTGGGAREATRPMHQRLFATILHRIEACPQAHDHKNRDQGSGADEPQEMGERKRQSHNSEGSLSDRSSRSTPNVATHGTSRHFSCAPVLERGGSVSDPHKASARYPCQNIRRACGIKTCYLRTAIPLGLPSLMLAPDVVTT